MLRRNLLEIIRAFRRRDGHRPSAGLVIDDDNEDVHLEKARQHMVDALIDTAAAFIKWGRENKAQGFSTVEKDYMFGRLPDDFDEMSDAEQTRWLKDHREANDHGLIIHVINNYETINYKRYRLQIFYILNTLAISDRWF
jgi:hypothetical protein